MSYRHSIADVASLLGEPSRVAMLIALLSGRALPAGELAREARLSAAATSLHLAKLTQGGLLAVRKEGRHRYYRLANAQVAHALEALGVIATGPAPARSVLPGRSALREARTCYDHLAGATALALAEMFERERILQVTDERSYDITEAGGRWFARALAIDVEVLKAQRRALARRCLDWTERRPHVAGALGAAILTRLVETRWLACVSGSRVVRVTAMGRTKLAGLGVQVCTDPRS
ncbi:MAG: transcriptional regulator, ArsR family [Myxococcaceae bacterium]|nr:transcriptional regulator, ArsR family [Myxococcaceae bacterium]